MGTAEEISPREAGVLELVGAHLSNAEIAARLFISVRTVESHVSSLLRKLEAPDRRALARLAPVPAGAGPSRPVLPAPLTSFVGRVSERAELAGTIRAHRQVTAIGPGGVGKTRLALAVAAEVAGEFGDGVWFVDLVPVTDPGMVAAAVAGALGLGEQPGRDLTASVLAALADRHVLLVLDNCEHVVDGVALFLERLLAACPRVTVLATSRARLMVPFERVSVVPPLSLDADGGSDAVALFMERAAAVGRPLDRPLDRSQRAQIVSICARLDGMALAIELAAARYPTLGFDGITAALSHPLRMLTGGSRADERHRSVRAALDWSHALLEPADRELLRWVSVFVAPFTAGAAAQVTGQDEGLVADVLARLAEQSLLTVTASMGRTEYRALETIRQYGTERLDEAGELAGARSRHLRWCLAEAAALAAPRPDRHARPDVAPDRRASSDVVPDWRASSDVAPDWRASSDVAPDWRASSDVAPDWRARFDLVADDLRAALAWAAERPEQRVDAFELARCLAELTFTRHLPDESQRRYEQAAALAAGPAAAASMLRQAAAVAGCRTAGDDMYRLRRAAADAARASGDLAGAAADLASAATIAFRFSSTFVRLPSTEDALALITEAREAVGGDPAARAALALAEAAVLADAFGAVQGPPGNTVPETMAHAGRAVELARRTGDPLAESAALDALTGAQSWAGDTFATAATARQRIALLSPLPVSPAATHELIDALGMASEAGLGAGDLRAARRWARQLADHPSLAEAGHRATCRLLMVAALAGDVDEVLAGSVRYRDAWRRGGSPARSILAPAAAGVAMVHGLRDDEDARREWQEIVVQLGSSPEHVHGYGAVFDAILLLHQGRAAEALERVAPEPRQVWKWVTWIWHHWYVALRSEAAVLAGSRDARAVVAEARAVVAGNPVAGAIVERAGALLDGDREALLGAADAFDAAGCPYQSARTRVLAGGEHAGRGAAALAALDLAPMRATGRGR
ncbi:ATPase [Nonomuraea sp. PA05]|uniref:ATP-binding protein n=1 Tax=Nonomuraea sp. PA05 TaxID=2604466 RepID=UPI0011D54496|nr:LuxR C-terminal-related transcriptional regulator [Nonomuraea sp. PA05]TYB60285.1 ATPase [Nonomuraea sp. PA05]